MIEKLKRRFFEVAMILGILTFMLGATIMDTIEYCFHDKWYCMTVIFFIVCAVVIRTIIRKIIKKFK